MFRNRETVEMWCSKVLVVACGVEGVSGNGSFFESCISLELGGSVVVGVDDITSRQQVDFGDISAPECISQWSDVGSMVSKVDGICS